MRNTTDWLRVALGMMAAVTTFGTVGYWLFRLSLLDAVYQTVTTVTITITITIILLFVTLSGRDLVPELFIVAVDTDEDLLCLENLAKSSS